MKRWLKRSTLVGLLLLASASSAAAPLDSIVAVVNDNVITQSQLNQQIRALRQQTQGPISAGQLRQQALQHLIDTQLQLQLADKLGIKVSDAELQRAIEQIAGRNGLALAQLKEELQQQGTAYAEFRQEIRRQMMISQLQQRSVGPSVVISNQDVLAAKDTMRQPPVANRQTQYHVFDLVVPFADQPTEQELATAKKRAQELAAKLKAGADFKRMVLAGENEQPPLQGGDLGWHPASGLPDLFAPYIKQMQAGDISDPIQAPNGWHIIKLVQVQGGGNAAPKGEDLHKQAQQLAFQRKFDEAAQKWLEQLRKQAYIKVM